VDEDRTLGLDRPIARRDFLQGMALAVGAPRLSLGSRGDETASPTPGGLQGQDPRAMALGHRVRNGEFRAAPRDVVETGESHDLVVVGAGIAGLTAAYLFNEDAPGEPSILVLENADDFGGHARRNVLEGEGVRLVAAGGTFALEEPEHSPEEALDVFRRIGLDPDRLVGYRDPGFRKRYGLSQAVIFDSRVYGGTTRWVTRWYEVPYERFFAQAPLPDAARKELVELFTTRKNYLPGVTDLRAALGAMSWERFVREHMGLGDHAVRFVNLFATDLVGLGADAVSAWEGYQVGPGFFGMGGEGFRDEGGILRYGYEPIHRFPDGNHTVARMLLKGILPESLSGPNTMDGVFEANVHRDRFDRAASRVRLRLSSMVVRIEERNGTVEVTYVGPEGPARRVRARHVIMTGWGSVAKHVVPDLSSGQRQALEEYRYCSAVYVNVMLRNWRPLAKAGALETYWPGGYFTWFQISDPLHVGGYRPDYKPDKPTVLSLYKYIHTPGLDPSHQMRLGRMEMEQKPFEAYEREIRAELNHILGAHGFDAARDILGITVNRWGHGYNFFKAPSPAGRLDPPPYRKGRERLGRISFAGADAGGTPWTQAAMVEASRAVREQLSV
jgi:spermidine dehydrogenase